MFCEPPQLKRKVYNRESKLKGKVFIKVVTGKNKKGKKGKKHDLETGFNDIDMLLENMGKAGKAEMSVDKDSNMEKCNLQVATINQMEEVQIKKECTHNNSTELGKEKIEMEVTEGIAAEVKEVKDIFTDGIVTYGTGSEDKMVTKVTDDAIVTNGTGMEDKMVTKVTDNVIVTDGTGMEDKMDTQIRDGKETGDTETVAKEVKEGIETEVTNNMATVQATEREQPAEQVLDKNVTVQFAEFTETNAMEEIRENIDNSDMEPLTEKDDDRDSTDSTDDTDDTEAVTIDKEFSKVCSTCPSNPESESSSSSSKEKESDTENNEVEMKEKRKMDTKSKQG